MGSLILFFVVTNLSDDPVFSVASSILLFVFALEAFKFRVARKALNRVTLDRRLSATQALVGEELSVELECGYKGAGSRGPIEIEDVMPEGLQVSGGSNTGICEVKAPRRLSIAYTVKALEMGSKTFGGVVLRLSDRFGLFSAEKRVDCISLIKVYPRIILSHVAVQRRPSSDIGLAEKGSRRRSRGTETTGVREYAPGDEFRMIAWKAMAHSPTHTPMTKEQGRPRILDFSIVFWPKASMKEGPVGLRKIDYAVQASLSLAQQCMKDGHLVSFLVPLESGFRLAKGGMIQLAEAVAEMSFRDGSISEVQRFCNVDRATRKTMMFISDAPYPSTLDLEPLRFLKSQGHDIYMLLVHPPPLAEQKDECRRLAIEILGKIEEKHLTDVAESCDRAGLHAFSCRPEDLSTTMMGILAEFREISFA